MTFGVRPWEVERLRPDEMLLMEAVIEKAADEVAKIAEAVE